MIQELSIIIPTLNEEVLLPKLLTSITDQQFNGKLEVIIVDGQSEDNTITIAKKYEEQIPDLFILSEKRNVSLQRNSGVKKARYKYLLFLDADIILPHNFLNRLALKVNPNKDFVDFILTFSTEKKIADLIFVLWMYALLTIQKFYDPLTFGSFLLTTKNVFERVGGFNEKAIIGEDVEFGRKALQLGAEYHLHYRPYALVSPRRERLLGRRKTFYTWARMYFYMKKHKTAITDKDQFYYPFGSYKSR